MGFNSIYWTPMGGLYFLMGSNLEKYGNFWKNGRFSGRIRPDWGNTARADMAGLGSIGIIILRPIEHTRMDELPTSCVIKLTFFL